VPTGEPDLQDPPDERPRRLLSTGFWAFLAFGMLCVLAGVGVVLLGPTLWTTAPPAAAAPRAAK
jgi:hypothetical protein